MASFMSWSPPPDKTDTMAGQTRQCLDWIDEFLAEAGTDKSKLVTATVYLADMARKSEMNDVWIAWADHDNPCARVCVGIAFEPRTAPEEPAGRNGCQRRGRLVNNPLIPRRFVRSYPRCQNREQFLESGYVHRRSRYSRPDTQRRRCPAVSTAAARRYAGAGRKTEAAGPGGFRSIRPGSCAGATGAIAGVRREITADECPTRLLSQHPRMKIRRG